MYDTLFAMSGIHFVVYTVAIYLVIVSLLQSAHSLLLIIHYGLALGLAILDCLCSMNSLLQLPCMLFMLRQYRMSITHSILAISLYFVSFHSLILKHNDNLVALIKQ